MAIAKKEVRGRIHGKTVRLEEDPGLPDGSSVRVIVEACPPSDEERRAALLRAAGAWAGDDEEGLEQYLESIRRQRKLNRPEIEE